jgi:HEAT repeat
VLTECQRRGRVEVVADCVGLIQGGDGDAELLAVLAGPAARGFIDTPDRRDRYWLRVWGVRGLLWGWDETGLAGLKVALQDDAWRVREMAAKVVARHLVGECLREVARLTDDPVPRVRSAAQRALVRLTEARA